MTTRAGELITGVVDNYSSGIKAFLLSGDDATLDATGYGSSAMVFFRAGSCLVAPHRGVTGKTTIATSVVSPMANTDNMVIQVTNLTGQQDIVAVIIEVSQPAAQLTDLAYDSANTPVWGLNYSAGAVASIANGWQYTFTRAPTGKPAGWHSATTTFLVRAFDQIGFETTQSFAMTITAPISP